MTAKLVFPEHENSSRLVMKMDPDTEKVKQALDGLTAKLDVYERVLSKQKYIAGDVGAAFVKSRSAYS